ncbi:glycosylphosphatidylinositol anchor biosynthesis, partial [Teratosphaeriaceae sp. CCFEE 6253]
MGLRQQPSINPYTIFGLLLALRLANALSVQTFFQPDEYFQALEPAWQLAFGPGSGAWITWEWREHLRSSLHPMLFAAAYRLAVQLSSLLHVLPSSRATILLAAPKVLQAVIAAAGDHFTWLLAVVIYGPKSQASLAALGLSVLSPWQYHCSIRSFSNSMETTLTVAALYYWPWHWFLEPDQMATTKQDPTAPQSQADVDPTKMVRQFKTFLEQDGSAATEMPEKQSTTASRPDGLFISLSLAAVACILRPTNVIIWAAISVCLLSCYGNAQKLRVLLSSAVICGSSVLALSLAMDRAYYGQMVFPSLKFLYVNIVQAVAGFYGTNRIDYYITEGLPLLLTTALPFAALGTWHSVRPGMDRPGLKGYVERQTKFVLATAAVTTVLAMTMISHKEVRFIYPLLPMLHVLAAKPLKDFFSTVPVNKVKLGLLSLMLVVNIYIAAYVNFVHQRGVVDVMHYLRHEQEARLAQTPALGVGVQPNITVGFLMPCHSTPWRSHLIYPEIKAWALTCEPPLGLTVEERRRYEDEADIFYNHPASWIDDNLKDRKLITTGKQGTVKARAGDEARREWPEYLVFFEHLEPVMNAVLDRT